MLELFPKFKLKMLSKSFKINSAELVDTIHATADKFGAKGVWGPKATQTGVCRMSLTDVDKKVRDWFVQETKSLGCFIKVDEVGNIFATFPGKYNNELSTGIGSHLDTQPTGGRYDGIYGVLSGLQVLRTLKKNNYVPNFPITLVDWCNEEGARFPMSCMSSAVWAGKVTKEKVYQLADVYDPSIKVIDELKRIGYLGNYESSYKEIPLNSHFEIHIEQGPVLEQLGKKIGVVVSAQAYEWLDVTFKGMAQHTGTTPLKYRRDALLATSKVICGINDIAKKYDGFASVGKVRLEPDVVNVIPELVNFVIDLRHHSDEGLAKMSNATKELIEAVSKNYVGNQVPLPYEILVSYSAAAAHFDPKLVDLVETTSKAVVGEDNTNRMVSGAGHDSCCTSIRCPTAMIFVPSKNGISHNPKEHTDPNLIETGFKVLLECILQYDEQRLKEM